MSAPPTALRPADARYVAVDDLVIAYLEDGPPDGPLALCLHGFPDHARTWRLIAPALTDAGYRVVAPWLRGYAPTAIPADQRYDLDALAGDANALHSVLGGDDHAIIIGHDWGALAAYRAVTHEPEQWAAAVGLAVPPDRTFLLTGPDLRQMRRSWYIGLFQLPGAESIVARRDFAFIDKLWRDWSPGLRPDPRHLAAIKASLRSPGVLTAALAYYRQMRDAVVRHGWPRRGASRPLVPTLYLHGSDDGCLEVDFAAPASTIVEETGGRMEIVDNAGHFLHLERPREVANRVLGFLAERTAGPMLG